MRATFLLQPLPVGLTVNLDLQAWLSSFAFEVVAFGDAAVAASATAAFAVAASESVDDEEYA